MVESAHTKRRQDALEAAEEQPGTFDMDGLPQKARVALKELSYRDFYNVMYAEMSKDYTADDVDVFCYVLFEQYKRSLN